MVAAEAVIIVVVVVVVAATAASEKAIENRYVLCPYIGRTKWLNAHSASDSRLQHLHGKTISLK
jgi:hypothetical protein